MITTPNVGDLVLTPDRKQAMVEKVEGKYATVGWHEVNLHWIKHSRTRLSPLHPCGIGVTL